MALAVPQWEPVVLEQPVVAVAQVPALLPHVRKVVPWERVWAWVAVLVAAAVRAVVVEAALAEAEPRQAAQQPICLESSVVLPRPEG